MRNETRLLCRGLGHEEMIEGIAVMKRESSKSNKMRVFDIQPVETLMRQNRKDLFYIGIELAIRSFRVISQSETILMTRTSFSGSPIRRRAWLPSFSSSFSHHNKACVSRSNLTPRLPSRPERPLAGCRSLRQF